MQKELPCDGNSFFAYMYIRFASSESFFFAELEVSDETV